MSISRTDRNTLIRLTEDFRLKSRIGILHWTWCFPQSMLGIMLLFLLRISDHVKLSGYPALGAVIAESNWILTGVSLGKYVFIAQGYASQPRLRLIQHELGHCRQSLLLGPVYLLVIGIPSLTWAVLKSSGFFKHKPYSWMYTEKWADRLAERMNLTDIQ